MLLVSIVIWPLLLSTDMCVSKEVHVLYIYTCASIKCRMTSSCHLINSLGKQEILLIYIAPVARAKENLPLYKSAETDVYILYK